MALPARIRGHAVHPFLCLPVPKGPFTGNSKPANALEAGAYVLSGNESIRGILSQVGSVARTLISALGLPSSPEIQSLVEIAWDINGHNLNAVAWLTCASSHKNHFGSPKAEVLFMVHNKFQQQLKMVSVSNQLPECYVG